MTRLPRGILFVATALFAVRLLALSSAELKSWYEQAYAYYSAVRSGAETRPDPAEWREFLNQMDWARQQLGIGPAWTPPGATRGPAGALVWKMPRVRIADLGVSGVHDIWSNDITLNVSSFSARVVAEVTNDTRLRPPEEVIKITVTDPASGTSTTYFIHDYGDTHIVVNVPRPGQVTASAANVRVGVLSYRKPGPPPGLPRKTATPVAPRR